MKKIFAITLFLSASLFTSVAQEHDHAHGDDKEKDMSGHHKMEMSDSSMAHELSPPMSHMLSLNLSMNRNGSGTGWLPDASPMFGYMLHSKKWMYMFHGNIFLRYNNQDITNKGDRGDAKFDVPNWFMGMGQRRVGNSGLLSLRAMISLDPIFVGGEGYPLLFQSGETWQGVPLVDRQHPHDLFSELAISYSHMVSSKADVFVYFGFPGEPAFGPVAFMHRVSSLYNPDAPIGHHWQDATHITFGVGTVGIRYGRFKLESSLFTGREPDEERYGFDTPRFDSWSTRLSYNPIRELALQVSRADVKDVHQLGPREDVIKTTASAIHAMKVRENIYLNSAAVWGLNEAGGHHAQHSLLFESALTITNTTLYGKYEWVEKSSEDLLLEESLGHDALFKINAVTIGINQNLVSFNSTNLSLGVQGSVYMSPKELHAIYGENPKAFQVYLRVYPDIMNAGN